MISLLDVNVLVSLIDTKHQNHGMALKWFASHRAEGWATCPITENGVIRIVGTSTYPNYCGSLAQTIALVRALCQTPGHTFWPDDFSLLDGNRGDVERITNTAQITDVYLLSLAVAHEARFVTFDRRIAADIVHLGLKSLYVLQ